MSKADGTVESDQLIGGFIPPGWLCQGSGELKTSICIVDRVCFLIAGCLPISIYRRGLFV